MHLTNEEFNTLVSLDAKETITNPNAQTKLVELGYVNEEGLVSQAGYDYLEPHRIKRAIFVAAGFGSRLVPLTLEKPKPLIKVHGKRIIDGAIDAVLELGITDITLIRGYKKECMDELLKDYPMIKFVDNNDYDVANNIGSLHLVKDQLSGSYVIESDLVLYNPKILKKYARQSHYLSIPVDETDDWCFEVEDDRIVSVSIGGTNTHQMVGISYWNEVDGKSLSHDIGDFYSKEANHNRFWDEVSLVDYKENYDIGVNNVSFSDIIEIDTYDELKEIDSSYQ